jgi:hypothetical protein
VPAALSNAKDPANGATTSSTECAPYAQSLAVTQLLSCAAPSGQWPPQEICRVHMGVGESSSHAGASTPDLPSFSPMADQHVMGPVPDDFQLASSRAVPAGATTPTTVGPASANFARDAGFSAYDSGTNSHKDPAGTIGSHVLRDLLLLWIINKPLCTFVWYSTSE